MIDVVNNLNDVMHASYIVGFGELKSMGRLLKRDQLLLSKLKRNISNRSSAMSVVNRLKLTENNKTIELFLFEKSVIICKRKSEQDILSSQSSLQASQTNLSSHSNSLTNNNNANNISLQSTNQFMSTSTPAITTPFPISQFPTCQYFYQFKESLKMDEIGITENIKNDKKKFELWTDTSSYIFEASSEQLKQAWVSIIKNLLESQLNAIKCKRRFHFIL